MESWVDLDTEGWDRDLGTAAREVGNGNLGEDTKTKCGKRQRLWPLRCHSSRHLVSTQLQCPAPPQVHTAPPQITLFSAPSPVPPFPQLCILIAFSFTFYPVMPTHLTKTKIL